MEYTGPAALNEGIKAIGEAFTSRPAISLQDLMQRKQLEQAMKPITLDELKAKTPPDLYEPMMKLAGSNGLIENVNGIQFIRQHNVKDFHKTLSENKVWQQMILDDSIKNSNALIEQSLPELQQRKAKHEARLSYWEDQRKKAMTTTDAKGNQMAPNMKAIDAIDREIAEYQQGDEFKQMTSLEKKLMGIKELQKRRLQSFGINEEGFKKDTEKYGPEEALKVSMYGSDYRRQLDRQLKEEKLQDAIALETAKAGLKEDKPVADIQEYEYAKKQGYKGSYVAWQRIKQKPSSTGDDKPGKLTDVEKQRLDIIRDNITALDKKIENTPNTDKYASQRATLEQQKKQLEIKRDKMLGTETPSEQKPATDKRSQAISALKNAKKPVTEANIQYVMRQIK